MCDIKFYFIIFEEIFGKYLCDILEIFLFRISRIGDWLINLKIYMVIVGIEKIFYIRVLFYFENVYFEVRFRVIK